MNWPLNDRYQGQINFEILYQLYKMAEISGIYLKRTMVHYFAKDVIKDFYSHDSFLVHEFRLIWLDDSPLVAKERGLNCSMPSFAQSYIVTKHWNLKIDLSDGTNRQTSS